MDSELRQQLVDAVEIALETCTDPAHDLAHALGVMRYADSIGETEDADPDVTTAAALFHDVVHYLPDDPRCDGAPMESACLVQGLLGGMPAFPQEKVSQVMQAILSHSAWLDREPASVEARVVRDADILDSMGAVGVMRAFACAGAMNQALYLPEDPLARDRTADRTRFALDYVSERMRELCDHLVTETGRRIAEQRTAFLECFLLEVEAELAEPTASAPLPLALVRSPGRW